MDEEDISEVYTHYNFTTRIIRVIDDVLLPSTIKFRVEFIPMETATEEEINLAFTKMRYWLDNVVSKSVVFSFDNHKALSLFIDENGANTKIANVLVITPGQPDDQHLAAIFQAKMQALSNGCMAFGPVDVKSDNLLGLTYTFVGDSSSVLPTAEEWFGENRTYFDKPWWDRDDGSTLDTTPPEDADLSVRPGYAFLFDFLQQPRHHVSQRSAAEEKTVVVRPEFRPTVHDGGKTKE